MATPNLQSTVNDMGKYVTQIYHFEGNEKLTYSGLMPETIKEGEFTKIMCKDGRMLLINRKKVLLIEVFKDPIGTEEQSQKTRKPCNCNGPCSLDNIQS